MAGDKPVKILVLEDDPDLRDIYTTLLVRDPNFVVRTTQDGAHGAALLRTEAYDLAIIDIRLPNMNGLQVVAVTRSTPVNRNIPIFIISGALDAENMLRAKSFSRVTILEKPFDSEALLKQIQAMTKPKPSSKVYDVRIINSVLQAASEVFTFYFDRTKVQIGKPAVRSGTASKRSGITGLISINGETFAGSLALVTDTRLVELLGSKLFQSPPSTFDHAMLADIMGELSNQVCGKIKAAFGAIGLKALIGLPEVVTGNDHAVHHKAENTVIFVPFNVEGFLCEVEFCLVERSGFKIDEGQAQSSVSGAVIF